jgi:hypothetical protein
VLGQGNKGRGLLDIHYKQHQKRLYRSVTARLRKNNIDTLLHLHLCMRATTAKPPQGMGLREADLRALDLRGSSGEYLARARPRLGRYELRVGTESILQQNITIREQEPRDLGLYWWVLYSGCVRGSLFRKRLLYRAIQYQPQRV